MHKSNTVITLYTVYKTLLLAAQ